MKKAPEMLASLLSHSHLHLRRPWGPVFSWLSLLVYIMSRTSLKVGTVSVGLPEGSAIAYTRY